MQRRITTGDDRQERGWSCLRHPKATLVGSTLGAGIVIAVAIVLGAGAIGFATTAGLGMVIGGWAGRRFGRSRERARLPREAVRRRRRIRILRITRTLHRRKL